MAIAAPDRSDRRIMLIDMVATALLARRHRCVAGRNMDLRPGDDGSGADRVPVVAGLVVVCVFLYRSMRKLSCGNDRLRGTAVTADRTGARQRFRRQRTDLTDRAPGTAPWRPCASWCSAEPAFYG